MKEDRIERLSQRFSTHAVGRKPASNRQRAKHTFYLDTALVNQLEGAYQELNHALYPQRISKSAFLETLLEYGLKQRADLKALLAQEVQEERKT